MVQTAEEYKKKQAAAARERYQRNKKVPGFLEKRNEQRRQSRQNCKERRIELPALPKPNASVGQEMDFLRTAARTNEKVVDGINTMLHMVGARGQVNDRSANDNDRLDVGHDEDVQSGTKDAKPVAKEEEEETSQFDNQSSDDDEDGSRFDYKQSPDDFKEEPRSDYKSYENKQESSFDDQSNDEEKDESQDEYQTDYSSNPDDDSYDSDNQPSAKPNDNRHSEQDDLEKEKEHSAYLDYYLFQAEEKIADMEKEMKHLRADRDHWLDRYMEARKPDRSYRPLGLGSQPRYYDNGYDSDDTPSPPSRPPPPRYSFQHGIDRPSPPRYGPPPPRYGIDLPSPPRYGPPPPRHGIDLPSSPRYGPPTPRYYGSDYNSEDRPSPPGFGRFGPPQRAGPPSPRYGSDDYLSDGCPPPPWARPPPPPPPRSARPPQPRPMPFPPESQDESGAGSDYDNDSYPDDSVCDTDEYEGPPAAKKARRSAS